MQDEILINHISQSLINSKIYDVVLTDINGDYVFVNETFHSRFSFITDDFTGKPSSIAMHPDEYLKIEEIVIKCFANPKHCFPVELRKPLQTGKGYNWTQWEFSAILDNNQEPIGILCIGFDITGPEHNNLQLKEFQTKLTKTIESIPHPMLILDDEQNINYINREFEVVFGFSISEIIGKKIEILFPEHHKENYNRLLGNYITENQKKIRVNPYRDFKNNKNENITVGISLNSFYDNGNLNIIMIIEDLTLAKQNQDTIINQNNAFRQIAWKHSHELRKPVANILGLSNLLDIKDLKSETNYKTISYLREAANELDLITQSIVKEAIENECEVEFEKNKRNLF
ncbi:PAS domain S-box protein [Psychroflexus sp. CAK57W]|uniref:PAS domain S-box protein n=1 Tax=Psychroflexus curvus TaxID=2873595 RepID=UPI001CCF31A8|nr:PAS domain S-box protein [Psychroflexus curvus]MBZ9787936.1 PAS domain S-box protein [Psychroflexus curvus]